MHGITQGAIAGVSGGSFWQGFVAGPVSSTVSSIFMGVNHAANLSATAGDVSTMFFGSVSGGLSAELTGGNFWEGAATGLTVSGLNHVAHRLSPDNGYRPDGNGGYEQVDTNGGDIIDYLYDENGNIVDRTLVYTLRYRSESPFAGETRTYGYRGIPEYSSVPQGGHALIDVGGDITFTLAGGTGIKAGISGLKNLGKWAFTSKSIGYQSKLFGRYSKTFLPDGKMGLLNNKNNLIRLGWGPGKGAHVFRLAVGNNRTMWYKHFDIIIGPKYGF